MKIKDRIKELRRVPAGKLLPNPKNWRTHPPEQADAMRGILAEVGFADAALAVETPDGLQLIDGHLRTEVAPDAEVPVLVLDVTEEEADRILATHDPIAAMAGSDANALAELLDGMKFDNDATQSMLDDLADGVIDDAPVDIEEDETPEPPAEPITQRGDLWQLGRHRLLCGDSTNEGDVSRLMDGKKAAMGFTSPPYNAGNVTTGAYRSGSAKRTDFKKMYNTDLDDKTPAEYKSFLLTIISIAHNILTDDAVFGWNVSYNANSRALYGEVLFCSDNLLPVQETIVWDKTLGMNVSGNHIYSRSAELVFLLSRTSEYFSNQCGGVFWNIWRISSRDGDNMQNGHGASFPVKLPATAIEQHSAKRSVVYDPFLGSGTTLIAAEQLDRTCYGMEISPAYCDVVVERWENLTGKKATKQEAK